MQENPCNVPAACAPMIAAAVVTGVGREVTEEHHASDVIVGFTSGFIAGWALPELLHLGLAVGVVAWLLFQTSCASLAYVTQAAAGQYDLNRRAREIDLLLREKRVDARTRRLLSQVAVIKRFAEQHGLATTKNYTKYARLDRPAAVWVVSASEPLRFRSKSWTFPLVGSFTYLGWFKLDEARAFAAGLRDEGWDVDVRGAGAYSTVGYFEDSVLSTMISEGPDALGELANVILHETAHATFFVKHQSTLNESVANFVGDTLADVYMEQTLGAGDPETKAYAATEAARARRERAMHDAVGALEALYASNEPDAQKLAEKRALIANLRAELAFRRPINNATLIQFRTYNSGQVELARLLEVCGGDFSRFIVTLKRLESAELAPPQESNIGRLIAPLIGAGCAPTGAP